jgi:hypothetical protein
MKTTIELAEQIRGPKGCDWWMTDSMLERFADLVRADERDACARVCESKWSNVAERMYGEQCATAIRARGNT